MHLLLLLAALLPGLATNAGAQVVAQEGSLAAARVAAGPTAHAGSSDPGAAPIRDNSFLVEEAYNQERGVVQHINTFARSSERGSWVYTLTEEWPIRGQRHQLGFTLPIERTSAENGGDTGIGDFALNYRYQVAGVVGDGVSATTAFAPRLTLLLPTGSSRRGLGSGGAAVQINLPLSIELPASLVAHSNVGAMYTPRARDPRGNGAATLDYVLAQSVIWHALPSVDLMIEAAWARSQEVISAGRTARDTEVLLAPGIRTAIDLASQLQIVPGIAFPIGVGPSRGELSVFVYLSLEHPFAREAQ